MVTQANHRGGDWQCNAGNQNENGNDLGGQNPTVQAEGLGDYLTLLWEILIHIDDRITIICQDSLV